MSNLIRSQYLEVQHIALNFHNTGRQTGEIYNHRWEDNLHETVTEAQ